MQGEGYSATNCEHKVRSGDRLQHLCNGACAHADVTVNVNYKYSAFICKAYLLHKVH